MRKKQLISFILFLMCLGNTLEIHYTETQRVKMLAQSNSERSLGGGSSRQPQQQNYRQP